MSSRTVPRFALTALLVAALAAPAVAQESLPQAPMPRAVGDAARIYHTICLQTLRDEVYALALMAQPEPPAPVPTMTPPQPPAIATPVVLPNTIVVGSSEVQYTITLPELRCVPNPTAAPGTRCGFGHPTCDVARLFQPGRVQLVGGVAGCGSFQHAREPHSMQFLMTCEQPAAARFFSFSGVCPEFAKGEPLAIAWKHFGVQPVAAVPLAGGVDVTCPPCPLPVAANPLNGTWYRDVGVAVIAVTFAGDEVTVRMCQREDDTIVTVTLTAHCTVTKDGLVFGAITSADADVKCHGKADAASGMEIAELSLMLQELIDTPFSFRTKMTSAGLMVSHLKVAAGGHWDAKELAILGGLYKRAKDGKVPDLKPAKAQNAQTPHVTIGAVIGIACEKPCAPGERIGVDFSTPVMGQPLVPGGLIVLPAPSAAVPPAPVRPVSAAPPDGTKQMAVEAFNQMMREKDRIVGDRVRLAITIEEFQRTVQDRSRGSMTLPSPRYLEHFPQYFQPDPAFPLPRELAAQEKPLYVYEATGATLPASLRPGAVGTWVREIGAKRCVVKVAGDHLTVTVSEAHEADGKTVAAHLVITADYHLTRDGMTAVGLITNVDARCDGDLSGDETLGMTQWVGELRRALEDKPLALTFRLYGDTLVIGNVRMPSSGVMEAEPATYLGGRYRAAGDKPLPALKATKASELRPAPVCVPQLALPPGAFNPSTGVYGAPPLPPGAFGPPVALPPVYSCPVPAPTGDLLPPQNLGRPVPVPAPVALPICEAIAPAIERAGATVTVPAMIPPVAPAPLMPQPVAPPVSVREPKPTPLSELASAWKNQIESRPASGNGQLILCGEGPKCDPSDVIKVKSSGQVAPIEKPNATRLTVPTTEYATTGPTTEPTGPAASKPVQKEKKPKELPGHLTPERIRGGIY